MRMVKATLLLAGAARSAADEVIYQKTARSGVMFNNRPVARI